MAESRNFLILCAPQVGLRINPGDVEIDKDRVTDARRGYPYPTELVI
jgi:hypothetical protein